MREQLGNEMNCFKVRGVAFRLNKVSALKSELEQPCRSAK